MARKSYKKHRGSRKNKTHRRRRQHGGDGGATGYVGALYGDLNQQMANSDAHNIIQPLSANTTMTPTQIGGRRRYRKTHRGGMSVLHPADIENAGALSHGQKGGNMINIMKRAIVPAGLFGLKQMYSKRMKSHRKH